MLSIFKAARAGDIAALTYWVEEKKVDINQKDNDGYTPFLWAAQSADLKTLKWLTEHSADVQLKNNKVQPPKSALYYMLFAHAGKPEWQAEKASWLLSQGLSMPESFKLLLANDLEALQKRYAQSPSVLKEKEAEIGYSLLHLAAGLGQLPSVLWLLQMGLSCNNANNQLGFTPLHVAASNGQVVMVEWLVREGKAEMGVKTDRGWTPLHEAASNGHIGVVEWLVREGKAEVGVKTAFIGKTPLHEAASNGHIGVVEWLVREGKAKVGVKTVEGWTPLHKAASNGHVGVVEWLVREGKAEVGLGVRTEYGGWTPLHKAARNGHVGVVEWLVQEGKAEAGVKDKDGSTPLHKAASNGQVGVVKWLVQEGKAEVGVKDKRGDTPLQYAIDQKHLAVQYWFRAHALLTQPAKAAKQSDAFVSSHLKDLRQLLSEVDQYTGKDKLVLVASLMRLYLEALATNRELQSNFFDASLLKYQNSLFSMLDQPEQQKLLQLSIKLGVAEAVQVFGRLQLSSLILQHIEFNAPQAKELTTFLQLNVVTSLNLQHLTFSDPNLQDLLPVLKACQSSLQTLTLSNSQLTDHKFLCLLPALLKCTKLQRLDLSGNLLSLTSLKSLLTALNKQPHPALAELSLTHNYIEIVDVRLFEELSSLLPENSPLKIIELAGNALWSEKHNKAFKAVWKLLLKRSQLTVQELIDAEFIKLDDWPEQSDKLLLQLKLSNQTVKDIQFNQHDVKALYTFKSSVGAQTEAQAFKQLKAIQKFLMPAALRQQNVTTLLTDEAAQNRFCKQILDYYPTSPLKSRLRTHPIFKSTPCVAIKSVIMPEREITLNDWYVYLISTNNNPLEDHAMIAYEGLTQYGQRFLRVAHLIAQEQGFLKSYEIKVEYFAGHAHKDSKGLTSTVNYLTQRCTLFAMPATRQQVNALDQAVQEDITKGINASYKWLIIGTVQSKQSKQTEVQNCLKWAIDIINKHLFIDDSAKITTTVYVPSQVVKTLTTQRPLPNSTSNPSQKVAPLDYAQGKDIKEGKQENNNNNSKTCLVM